MGVRVEEVEVVELVLEEVEAAASEAAAAVSFMDEAVAAEVGGEMFELERKCNTFYKIYQKCWEKKVGRRWPRKSVKLTKDR